MNHECDEQTDGKTNRLAHSIRRASLSCTAKNQALGLQSAKNTVFVGQLTALCNEHNYWVFFIQSFKLTKMLTLSGERDDRCLMKIYLAKFTLYAFSW